MKIEPFEMERMQSTWEHRVECNLSESGVIPLSLNELLDTEERRRQFLEGRLGYPQTNGTDELRCVIATLYPGASDSNILVTTGTAEANFIAASLHLESGDEVVFMMPNYMQIWGLARSLGATVRPFPLQADRGWRPDLQALREVVGNKTRLIAVCNPNNPTGAVLSEEEMDGIVDIARSAGCWILADEVYRGAELEGALTPSFWGRYEKVMVTWGLSKSFGLPGLRIGWIAANEELVARAWSHHDYTTISPSTLSDRLARLALEPQRRTQIWSRTREILNANLEVLRRWVRQFPAVFSMVEPRAAAIACVRYNLDRPSEELVEELRIQRSVLVVPGAHFHMGHYLRIGYGYDRDQLQNGLSRIAEFLRLD